MIILHVYREPTGYWECDMCGCPNKPQADYCAHCGADIDGNEPPNELEEFND